MVSRALIAASLLASSACYVRGPGPALLATAAGTAILTAAVISATAPPPPPHVVVVPPPQPGYEWQPGYWTARGGRWVWIEGGWVASRPGAVWSPAHWERAPDGSWQLLPGRWMPSAPPPPFSDDDPLDPDPRASRVATLASSLP